MAGKSLSAKSSPFEYVLFEGDTDEMRTVTVLPYETSPWIDKESLKLRHRIGRGQFGDVWLATHHHSTEEYDDYHEVAIKTLSSVKEGNTRLIIDKLNTVFKKCRGMNGVCQLLGFSVINGKISIVMKFYEGSIGDRMAQLQGGRFPFRDVLRYGISLAQAIMAVHSKDILILNLKPSNVLLSERNQAILGDVGTPFLLLGASLSNPDMTHRLGTPNYMAPEQWEPEVRGPISFETDSWGFGCSILEMLTGVQPWSGNSAKQIYHSVVRNHERPVIPSSLPHAVKNVLSGCFEYDLRNRPRMIDIIQAFQSTQDELAGDDLNIILENSITTTQPTKSGGYTEWFLSKDQLVEGDLVRSRKPPNSHKAANMAVPEGKVVGAEGRDDQSSAFVLVRVHGFRDPLRIHTSMLERVTKGFAAGDWVRLRDEQKQHSDHHHLTQHISLIAGSEQKQHSHVGILHSIDRDGNVTVGFIGLETLWKGKSSDLQMSEAYYVGQFVRPKPNVLSPRFAWPYKRGAMCSPGKITEIHPNGCLVVKFPGKLPFGEKQGICLADPAEVETVSFESSRGIFRKYQHLEDFHWAVRPVVVAFGIFTAVKLGLYMGQKIRRSKGGKEQQDNARSQTGGSGNGSAWIPSVTNMIQGR